MTREQFFITGTDTDVGKTFIACHLLRTAQQRGLRSLGLKPLAAGAQLTADGLRNSDALLLQQYASVQLPYAQINPYCFAEAVAPHIAAAQQQTALRATAIAQTLHQTLNSCAYDYAVIEGAGGWRVPLNNNETLADVARLLQLPVILVVGMKLGCLNHALLTAEAIRADGLHLHGWIANDLGNPMPQLAENIRALEQRMPAPRMDVSLP